MVARAAQNSSAAPETHGVSAGLAWALTARMSPRGSVQELTDPVENLYAATRAITGPAPERPWAMHLANAHGYFRWVCFDLDSGRGNTRKDAKRLAHWLGLLGIPYLECISGPTGGRHIWISVDHLHPQAVNTVGILAKQLLPTLDTTPLSARGNGAVRPPLTPHRTSGHSRPLNDVDELVEAAPVDAAAFRAFEQLLEAEGAVLPTPALAGARGVVADSQGVRYLAGDRRNPSARILTLLDGTSGEIASFDDFSVLQMTVLAGLARARWRFADVAAHLDHSPAFEHSRTVPAGIRRLPRRGRDSRTVLLNDWARAVAFIAANPVSHQGDDSEYAVRVAPLVDAVEAVQARADAVPGYWGTSDTSRAARGHAGRPSWRSVLDAVCVYILRSARPDPHADVRRLAEDTGYSQEACRQALTALSSGDSPWLERTEQGEGTQASRFRLQPRTRVGVPEQFSTDPQTQKLPRGVTPPPEPASGLPRLQPLLRQLSTRLWILNRDLFSAPGSMGRRSGRLLQEVSEEYSSTEDLLQRTRSSRRRVRCILEQLHRVGVVVRVRWGWCRARDQVLESVDARCATAGYLAHRVSRRRADRVQWRWWLAEVKWSRLPRGAKRRRPQAAVTLLPLEGTDAVYPAYPRSSSGKADHTAAYRFAVAGVITEAAA